MEPTAEKVPEYVEKPVSELGEYEMHKRLVYRINQLIENAQRNVPIYGEMREHVLDIASMEERHQQEHGYSMIDRIPEDWLG